MADHVARQWVEAHFPDATGPGKVALILAYGAGVDAGLAEAQAIIANAISELGQPAE